MITESLREDYVKELGLSRSDILVLPDGADPAIGRRGPPPFRKEDGRLAIGYAGHLYPGKGMEIIASLAPLCRWADFHVVGGLSQDIRHWRSVCAQTNNLTFHGAVPHGEVGQFIATFDVVLLPNQRVVRPFGGELDIGAWTSPLKLFEYMANGRPIVSSDLPVLREVLDDQRNALLCDPEDLGTWVAALERLRDDEQLRGRLGAAAKADLLSRYTWRHRAERLIASL